MIYGFFVIEKATNRMLQAAVATTPNDLLCMVTNPNTNRELSRLLSVRTIAMLPGTSVVHDCPHCKAVLVVGHAICSVANNIEPEPLTQDDLLKMRRSSEVPVIYLSAPSEN